MAKKGIARLMDFRGVDTVHLELRVDKDVFVLRRMYLTEGFDGNLCRAWTLERRSLLGDRFLSPDLLMYKHPMIRMFHHTVSECFIC